MFKLSGKQREKIAAVVDVGSGSAGVSILVIKPGVAALALAAERAVLPPEERREDAIIAGIGQMITQAGTSVLKAYTRDWQAKKGPVGELYVVVHAPWARAKTVQASKKFPEETRVHERMISELAREALGKASSIAREDFLAASMIRVELNGYPTREPEGMRAHEIAITGLVSDLNPRMRSAIQSSIGGVFPHLKPTYRSSARALLSVLAAYEPTKEFIAVDVASEATTVIAVHDGIASDQFLVPEGVRALIARITEKGMPEETLTLLRMIEREHCENEACGALTERMARAEPELVRIFGEVMGKMAAQRRLPNHLILMTQADVSPWLARFFSRIDFTQFTQTAQPFTVRELTAKDLAKLVMPAKGILLDTPLAISTALVNIEHQGT